MLPTAFALLVAIAGWYYLFYSRAASRLAGLEAVPLNRWRIVLRRLGGLTMLLLAVFFFAGFHAVDLERPGAGFYLVWTTVLLLLLAIVVLAAVDLVLTVRLRRHHRA